MAKITQIQMLSLYVGGADGNKRQNASTALTGGEVHLIKVLVDGTTFSALSAIDQDGNTVNMLTANNLTSKVFNEGDLVFAPFGGYISAFTASQETEYFKMPSTERSRQEP